jgi:hypothetical protein
MGDSDIPAGHAGPPTRSSQPFSSVTTNPHMDSIIEWRTLWAQERRQRYCVPSRIT